MSDALKHFGILAHSAEGAALCFTTFCHEGGKRLGPDIHPDVTVDCIAFGHCMDAWDKGDFAFVRNVHAQSVTRLAKAGADFFACADNTSHIALEHEGPAFDIPGLNIGDVVAAEARRLGMKKVGVLGTRFTMEGPVYKRALAAQGIERAIPDARDGAEIDRVVFEELVRGKFLDASKSFYAGVIEKLAAEGCDGVAMVCTEIPILLDGVKTALPALDSTRLLAKAALDVARGAAPMPQWRGGPVGEDYS
ncbi:aspartate/glutamate racemase family protein [Hyphococcus sp.]|uniref:aspartate/glutamate racemase family protein n=1 Tax=Hyphococcus sp. TaxID=2038636 RepID=UPI0035C6FBDF